MMQIVYVLLRLIEKKLVQITINHGNFIPGKRVITYFSKEMGSLKSVGSHNCRRELICDWPINEDYSVPYFTYSK